MYKDAKVIAGEEVMTPRPKEQRNGKTLRENIKGPRGDVATAPDGGGVGGDVPGVVPVSIKEEEWTEMHENLK